MLNLIEYDDKYRSLWDNFIDKCPMATFLHTRKFLSYHGDKYEDQSLLLFDENNKLNGIYPSALSLLDKKIVVSHPGITFGGVLHQGKLVGVKMIESISSILEYYRKKGFQELLYKPIPSIYHKVPSCDDLYALFCLNAELYRRDLSCTIDLLSPTILTNTDQSKLRNCIRKAEKNDLSIKEGPEYLSELWEVLSYNLKMKYNTMPVHSLEEISLLNSLFPDKVKVLVALLGGKVVAGTVLFLSNEMVAHTQYLVVTSDGAKVFALDTLVNYCIEEAKKNNYRYFDFGINTGQNGRILNNNLYLSKTKHGGSGTTYDLYKINLQSK